MKLPNWIGDAALLDTGSFTAPIPGIGDMASPSQMVDVRQAAALLMRWLKPPLFPLVVAPQQTYYM